MTDRRLALLRHAKAAHPAGIDDMRRALTARGHADAAAAGGWLAGQQLFPDVVLCSPARRTRETWHGVALALGADATGTTVVYDPGIYKSTRGQDLLEMVMTTGPDVTTLLVIGHNPTLSALSSLLYRSAGDGGLRTCGIAVHRVPGPWGDLVADGAPIIASHTARA
jgi:phosphohistidine phosphatase